MLNALAKSKRTADSKSVNELDDAVEDAIRFAKEHGIPPVTLPTQHEREPRENLPGVFLCSDDIERRSWRSGNTYT